MMTSLFSVFDPTVSGLHLNWVSFFVIFSFFPFSLYLFQGGVIKMIFGGVSLSTVSFKEISFPNYTGLVLLSCSVFMFIMLNNVLGLFSFIFTSTAHPMFTMSIGLVYWVVFMVMGWVKNFMNSAAHLVPEGSPMMLAPVLVLIELVSHLMRPFTLSIRLAANMMAGHLIVGLLASISLLSYFSFFISLGLQFILLILECGVAIIQGLVFSILMILYALDYY